MIYNIDGFVPFETYKKIAKNDFYSYRKIEKLVFQSGLTPLRYKRNQNSISQKEQYKLFKSHICIVGCGGLGGFVAEFLARIGIGKLTLIDGDTYSEHNLNRQNFSNFNNIGKSKAEVVSRNLKKINPTIKRVAKVKFLTKKNIKKIIVSCDVVIDCLDDIKCKKLLAKFCKKNSIDFVHGAIAGWNTQATTSKNLDNIYKDNHSGVESVSGNLVFSASFCASIQVSLAIKLLLKKDIFAEELLFCDLKHLDFVKIPTT